MTSFFKNKKAAESGVLVGIVIILALMLLILLIFFSNDGFFANLKQEILTSLRSPLPEKDPLLWERDFFKNQDNALQEFNNMMNAFETAKNSEKALCLTEFAFIDEDFFDLDFKILIRGETEGMTAQLWQWEKDPLNEGKGQNVARSIRVVFEEMKPCMVQGTNAAKNFYDDFIVDPKKIDASKKYSRQVTSLYLTEYEKLNYKLWSPNDPNAGNQEHEADFMYSGTKVYYILKQDKLLCLIPTHNDLGWECGSPDNYGFIDDDCLDTNGKTLPNNIKTKKIKTEYIC